MKINNVLRNIAGIEKLDVTYYQECDEFVTISGITTPLQDWQITDYYTQEIIKDTLNKTAKRNRQYCLNMWNYVFKKLRPFYIQPTTDNGFMYKHFVYNNMIFCVIFQYGVLFGITKYRYEQTTKNPF